MISLVEKSSLNKDPLSRAKKIFFLDYILNLVIIFLLSFSICLTIYKICDDNQSFIFLKTVRCLPAIPWQIILYSILMFVIIGFIIYFENIKNENQWLVLFLSTLSLLLCCLISYLLNFSYNGFFLLLVANAFLNIENSKYRCIFLILVFSSFIGLNYEILTVTTLKLVAFQTFISYYSPHLRIAIYGIKTTLDCINLILVIMFFYQFVQGKIKENKEFIKLNNMLENNINKLRNMTVELEEAAKIRERNRLAHEVHDILGHSLTCIDTGIEACIALTKDNTLLKQLKKIKHFSEDGLSDIRKSVHELEIDTIRDQSIIEVLKKLIIEINNAHIVNIVLNIEGLPHYLDYDEKRTIYRVVQESITNAINHGKSNNINVLLCFTDSELILKITDDGLGCKIIEENFGLTHMRDQVKLLGGSFSYESMLEKGFLIYAILPIRRLAP